MSVDSAGDVWVANASQSDAEDDTNDGSVGEIGPDGTVLQPFLTGGGIMNPSDTEVDAAQNVWVTNHLEQMGQTSESFSELAGSTSTSPGAALSPSTGFGLDANLVQPYALALDASGNVWISSEGSNSLVMFFGVGAPTKTPRPPTPLAP
jgi:streptogramin lyase